MKHLLVAAALLVSSLVNATEPSINDKVLKSLVFHALPKVPAGLGLMLSNGPLIQ